MECVEAVPRRGFKNSARAVLSNGGPTGHSLLFVAASHLRGDAVHIGAALLGKGLADDDAVVVVLDLLGSDEAGLLELVEAVADVLGSSGAGLLGEGAAAVLASVVASEAGGADSAAHVELVGQGSSTSVEPVIVLRSELLEAGSLNVGLPLDI